MATQPPARPTKGKNQGARNPNYEPQGVGKTNYESQGGGFRGGPKRWTGRGPPPARHIPWPEIFKHHISVIEGHKKMVDMVRKHTIEGTGNHRTIMDMVERSSEMLYMSKKMERSFAPPPNQRNQVPIGVSSDSMYPGYSPADHEYGKAAEEYGKAVAEAKKRGVGIPTHPEIEYEIGQGRGMKRKSLAQIRDMGLSKEQPSGSGSGSGEDDGPVKKQKLNGGAIPAGVKVEGSPAKKAKVEKDGENPYFVIDTNPTPVNLPPSKREADDQVFDNTRSKKPKKKHSGNLPTGPAMPEETEDISTQVDAKLKEKEEKQKQKEKVPKKRKRVSDKSDLAVATGDDTATAAPQAEESGKPNKKKKKVKDTEGKEELPDRTVGKKNKAGNEDDFDGKKRKTKKLKK